MFYFLIYIILAIVCISEITIFPKRAKTIIYILILLFFIVIGGLRWNTGNDWRPYQLFFTTYNIEDPVFQYSMEPGFALFVRFLRIFSTNYTFYLTVMAFLIIAMKGIFFYRFTNAIFLALILYWGIHLSDIIGVRQSLAISMCCLATIFIVDKKPVPFFIIVLLATQIHITSIIFFVAYYIYHVNWSVRSKYIWLILALIIGSLGASEKLLQLIIDYTPSGMGLDRISEKAESYMAVGNEQTYGATLTKSQRMIAAITKRAILLPLFFFFQNRFQNSHYKGFLNLYTFGNVLYFVVLDFLTLQRMAGYFYIFEVLLFCIVFSNVKSKTIWFLFIVLYSLAKLVSLVVNASSLLVPYIWIFSSDTYRFIY